MSQHTPEQLALKRAFADIVKGVGGLEAAALHCRVGKTALGNAASPNDPAFPALDVVADLEPLARGRAGWPHVTRALAQAQGFALVALPEPSDDADCYLQQLARLMKEGGDVAGALRRALEDGRICAADRAAVRVELWQLIEVAVGMHAALKDG